MNAELHIAGSFIYNGIHHFGSIHRFDQHHDIFEVLYSLSVGFERLFKVALVLLESGDYDTQDEFEKSLITHNHQLLINRLKSKKDINFSPNENAFFTLIGQFYKHYRYDRYCLDSVRNFDREKGALEAFLTRNPNIDFYSSEYGFYDESSVNKSKRFLGNVCSKISRKVYEVIEETARAQNIYTYEIQHGSKADKIFMRKECEFSAEELVHKELYLYLVKLDQKKTISKFVSNLEPIDFEECDILDVIDNPLNSYSTILRDSVESQYEEMSDLKDRIEQLRYWGSSLNYCDIEDE